MNKVIAVLMMCLPFGFAISGVLALGYQRYGSASAVLIVWFLLFLSAIMFDIALMTWGRH